MTRYQKFVTADGKGVVTADGKSLYVKVEEVIERVDQLEARYQEFSSTIKNYIKDNYDNIIENLTDLTQLDLPQELVNKIPDFIELLTKLFM